MNLTPIYELRNRLRTAMIAGTNLLSEDFRLKRAVEDIKPLEALSPVFAKINQMAEMLLSESCENKEGVLIDTITLVDALLCTQGQAAVEGDIEPIRAGNYGNVMTNAPYSVVKSLVEALTKPGSNHYQYVIDTHEEGPELFRDYRVKTAMVASLGAAYSELAEQVMEWLKEEGEEIIPLLKKDFNPKGKKEMVRRVQVMEAIAGGKCNDFYIQMIPEAEKDVKNALIYALRHQEENVEYLFELAKKEKGNAKKMAHYALVAFEDERVEKLFRDMYGKKPIDTMNYLYMSKTKWSSKMVSECLMKQLAICKEPGYGQEDKVFTEEETKLLEITMEALAGKNGSEICEVFRTAYEVEEIYYMPADKKKVQVWKMRLPERRLYVRREMKRFSAAMAYFLELAIRTNPDEGLLALAEELYTKSCEQGKREYYFQTIFVAKLLGAEDCCKWIRSKIFNDATVGKKKNKAVADYLFEGLKGITYDDKKEAYVFETSIYDIANDRENRFIQPLTQDIAGEFIDIFIEYCDSNIDFLMNEWVNRKDKAFCSKFEAYFYDRALNGSAREYRTYLEGLNICNCRKCEGLLVDIIANKKSAYGMACSRICLNLWHLPGDAESFEKEAMEVNKLVAEGKLKVDNWDEDMFFKEVEKIKEKKERKFSRLD